MNLDDIDRDVYTPEPIPPDGMTEERALEIWLRKDEELFRARLEREEESRREMGGDDDETSNNNVAEPNISQEGAARPSSNNPDIPLHDENNNFYIDDDDWSSSSGGDSNLPPVIPAAQSNSDAWQQALARNPCDPNDPLHRSSWLAYENFIRCYRPGLADNFVASTPGLARMIEEQKERDRLRKVLEAEEEQEQEQRQRARTEEYEAKVAFEQRIHQSILHVKQQQQLQQQQMHQLGNYYNDAMSMETQQQQQHQMMMNAHQQQPQVGMGNNTNDMDTLVSTMATRLAAQTQDLNLAAQAREYLRITQAQHLPPPLHIQVPSSVAAAPAAPSAQQQQQQVTDPILAQAIEYERLSQAHNRSRGTSSGSNGGSSKESSSSSGDKKKSGDGADNSSPDSKQHVASSATTAANDAITEPFFLATPIVTQYNTRAVTCVHCKLILYTHPLALNYFCQRCCQITKGGDAQQHRQEVMMGWNYQNVGMANNMATDGFEEKMMDGEDYS